MKFRTWRVWGGTLIILSIIFSPKGGLAADKKVYTLDECVKEALANNWKLKAKKETIDQAKYAKNQARAEFLPKLSTSYGYTRFGSSRTTEIQGSTYDVGSLNNYQ